MGGTRRTCICAGSDDVDIDLAVFALRHRGSAHSCCCSPPENHSDSRTGEAAKAKKKQLWGERGGQHRSKNTRGAAKCCTARPTKNHFEIHTTVRQEATRGERKADSVVGLGRVIRWLYNRICLWQQDPSRGSTLPLPSGGDPTTRTPTSGLTMLGHMTHIHTRGAFFNSWCS